MEKVRNQWELFLSFCFMGWIYESIWCCMIENNEGFVNRGFLHGPWLPIYGIGMMLILFFIQKLHLSKWPAVFVFGTVIATICELIGSYVMEFFTGSFLWDYKKDFLNFQGRIALKPDLMFGFLILLGYYMVVPKIKDWQEKYSDALWRNILSASFFILFLADILYKSFVG